MPTKQFHLKPHIFTEIGPLFFKYFIIHALAAATVYFMLQFLPISIQEQRLLVALAVITLTAGMLYTIHPLIQLLTTTYHFFDTHIRKDHGLIYKKRSSIPYKQISNVENNATIWNRLTNASDIILKSTREGAGHDLVLRAIKDADEVEHKIYRILKEHK